MIVGIEGVIEKKEPTLLHINVNGLIYEVFVSLNCSSNIKTDKVKLQTIQIIREDFNALYGFSDLSEKLLFDRLLKINGIGPKVALAIISTFTPDAFAKVLASNDISMLKKVPGIGPKGASRILVELSGFIINSTSNNTNSKSSDAALALESLGFKQDIILQVLSTCSSTETGELVKEALKKLQK
jgi:Holliday junction DNA helicase RuvA